MNYGVAMVRWRAKEGEEPGSSKDPWQESRCWGGGMKAQPKERAAGRVKIKINERDAKLF